MIFIQRENILLIELIELIRDFSLTLYLFRWKTFCKDSFLHFLLSDSTLKKLKKERVKGKLSLVNKKFY